MTETKSPKDKRDFLTIIALASSLAGQAQASSLTPEMIVRAWKDPMYRHSLTDDQRQLLPENPAGTLDTGKLKEVADGDQGDNTWQAGCHKTWEAGCKDTWEAGCKNTWEAGCQRSWEAGCDRTMNTQCGVG